MELLCSRSKSQWGFKMCQYLPGWYLQNHGTFCQQTWYDDEVSWARVSCRKKKRKILVIPRSRSQWGLIWSKYDSMVFAELLIHLQPNMVWWYVIGSQSALWRNWITAFKVKVTVKGQYVSIWADIFYTPKHFVTKLHIVMHYHELECHAKRSVCYFQGQGHSKGSYDQTLTVSTISWNYWSFCCQTWFDSTLS